MWLILLEAGLALGLFLFIIWWTMFHGRPREQAAPRTLPGAPAPGKGAAGGPDGPDGAGAAAAAPASAPTPAPMPAPMPAPTPAPGPAPSAAPGAGKPEGPA